MTGLRRWWQRWRRPETSPDALAALDEVRGRDAEVRRLGEELRGVQDRNHFSNMVHRALERGADGGT